MDISRGDFQEPIQVPKKKKKIGSLQRKTNEIIKKLAAIQVRADAFRKKLADGLPEITHIDSK
jgi:hypothetical protein